MYSWPRELDTGGGLAVFVSALSFVLLSLTMYVVNSLDSKRPPGRISACGRGTQYSVTLALILT